MKRTYIALSLAISLVVGGYFASAPSTACCGDGIAAAAGAQAAGGAVSTAIGTATQTVVQMLNDMNNTIASGFSQVAQEVSKQTASQRTFEEGKIQADTQLYMEEKRADAQQDFVLSPRACYEAQAASAVGDSVESTNQTVKNLVKGVSDRTLYTSNTAGAVGNVFRTHAASFCSEQDAKLGRCSTPVAADLQNADVRADNLLGRDVLSDAQYAGAVAYLNNVINAIPTQQIPKGWEKTDQGKAFIAGQLMEQGKLSPAALSLSNMIAMRRKVAGLGTSANLNVSDVSPLQLMKSQTNGRFLDPNWYKMIVGPQFGTVNQLREANKMAAFSLYMQQMQYEQNERIEAMLAADIATSVKRDSEQRLAKAREVAAKAR
ncbi:hypothetical protein [Xanthomonas citri]|uniref:hypothetical protein n=1 Tax=Xanthomonas citri TaxID=346 RepID=UPI001E64B0FF|nr:hypothetical protein [Xanthomonas citri]